MFGAVGAVVGLSQLVRRRRRRPRAVQAADDVESLAGKTDATGAHVLHIDFLSVNPAMPMSVDRERER